jgi:peptidoglycan/LPS O-acetylase OafA/YrhL
MKRKAKQQVLGIVLIIVSIVILYFNLKKVEGNFSKLWPSLVLLFGVFFYIFYFSTKRKHERISLLFLATFLAISSIPLYILTFTSFKNMGVVWPGFLFAIGMGFLSIYFYGKGRKSTLFLSTIMIGIALFIWAFYSVRYQFGLVVGVVFLVIGAAFLTRGLIKQYEFEDDELSGKGKVSILDDGNAHRDEKK